MKHLSKKLAIAGGKSKPKPKPATLYPPALGDHQIMSSFSYAEILDLISDGPIAGLVNKEGALLSNEAILQGIYLDDTAVAVTDRQASTSDKAVLDTDAITTTFDFSTIGSVFQDIIEQPLNTYSALIPDPSYKLIYARVFSSFYGQDDEDRIGSDILTESITNNNPKEYRLTNSDMEFTINPHYTNTLSSIQDRFVQLSILRNNDSTSDQTKEYMDATFSKILGGSWNSSAGATPFVEFLERKHGSDPQRVKSMCVIDAQDALTYSADSFVNEDGELDALKQFTLQSSSLNHMSNRIFSFVVPNLDANYQWDGTVSGFFLVLFDAKKIDRSTDSISFRVNKSITRISWSINIADLKYMSNITGQAVATVSLNSNLTSAQGAKYNYNNILAEFRNGEEEQSPLKYFNKVFIDKDYNRALLGPFNTVGQIQRITENASMLTSDANLSVDGIPAMQGLFAGDEGSQDNQRANANTDYANWDVNVLTFNEQAIPVTHIIENPNVESVFVSLQVNALHDTVTKDIKNAQIKEGENPSTLGAGSKYPTVVNIRVEIGRILANGTEQSDGFKDFQITSLAEQPAIVDIGNPDGAQFASDDYQYISNANIDNPIEGGVFTPFKLAPARRQQVEGEEEDITALPKTDEEETPIKRFVRVIKLSTETNSILISKDLNLLKVTEIIPVNLSYPFSAFVGVKVDSRTFSSIPTRTYDCKLKKVQIPTNYRSTYSDGRDRRYFDTTAEFDETSAEDKHIYQGDWDGSFVEGWTDNPAWVLYDLLTNYRYGLGAYIDKDKINKWELYRIARFCDSVDDDGFFIGSPDGRGGLEPRYSCNILFNDGTKVFDAINVVASLFRGAVFYGGSEINFLDDRVKDPTAFFANTNVKDGVFNYSNYRRDEQFNAIEVAYLDRFDNFKSKIEYVEDEEDISQRGLFKKQVNALGVTSKAMARRVGQHLIYQTIRENQSVTFSAGLETLLCKPGDLVIVEDELKTLSSNIGRVLDVDATAGTIRIDQAFITGAGIFDSGITIYTPTGEQSIEDLDSLIVGRSRLTGFHITGDTKVGTNVDWQNYFEDVAFDFSGYADGYTGDVNTIYPLQKQYPVYTGDNGTNSSVIWFSTGFTGWVFAINAGFADDANQLFIAENAGSIQMIDLDYSGVVCEYDNGFSDRRGAAEQIAGAFENDNGELARINQGILASELELNNTPQITTLSLTGSGVRDYGSVVYVDENDPNFSMLTLLPLGSPYRLTRTNADDQIYKIISIREEGPNEYAVVGNKYDSGKYNLIENDTSFEIATDTFGYGTSYGVNGVSYTTLAAPAPLVINKAADVGGGFYISIAWNHVTNTTGYNLELQYPDGTVRSDNREPYDSITYNNLKQLGYYTISVRSLGDPNENSTTRFYDSAPAVENIEIFTSAWVDIDYDASYLEDFNL